MSTTATGLLSGNWVTGTATLDATASDQTGIRSYRLLEQGAGVITTHAKTCDPTLKLPCDQPGGTSAWNQAIDTTALPDGEHAMVVQAYDAASNFATSEARTARIDNTAPAPPNQLRLVNEPTTATAAQLRWLQPGRNNGSPNATETVEVCRTTCTSTTTAIDEAESLALGEPGEYRVRVWTVDRVGLGSAANAARLTFTLAAPEPPQEPPAPPTDPAPAETPAPAGDPAAEPLAPPVLAARRAPGLAVTSVSRRKGRLTIRGTIDRTAQNARITVRAGAKRVVTRPRSGRWTTSFPLAKRARPTKVTAHFAGNRTFLAATASKRIPK